MAEPTQITFPFKEIATALVKQQNIHEGIWGVFFRFGIHAANTGPSKEDLRPAAIIPVLEMGIQKFEELNNLSVNASEVNPVSPQKTKSKKR